MKQTLLFLLLLTLHTVHSQEQQEAYIIQADSTWGKEIIKFPIEWAPKLTLEGYEELTFAPEWSKENHDDFWSIIMTWRVKTNQEIPLYELEYNLLHYFDHLMKPNYWAQEFPLPEAEFKAPITTETGTEYEAQLTFFDGFHTGKVITTYILGQQIFNQATEEAIIIFKISPKPYTEAIWEKLNAQTIITGFKKD
tara:strand:- start:585 stop:1169 length:585 start_codon:yes stop_codon:yes gene_type:complete